MSDTPTLVNAGGTKLHISAGGEAYRGRERSLCGQFFCNLDEQKRRYERFNPPERVAELMERVTQRPVCKFCERAGVSGD